MGTGLLVTRGDILLQRMPLPRWANHFPLGSKCSSRLRKSVCWGIQEGRPDSTLSAFQASFGLYPRPSIPHLQILLLYHKMIVMLHFDIWGTNFLNFIFLD